jgi:hypothetical protein
MSVEIPVIVHSETAWADGERVAVFTVTRPKLDDRGVAVFNEPDENGQSVAAQERIEYTMPGKPHVGMALAYLKRARNEGTSLAASWILEEALGSAGYDALASEPDLDPEILSAIIETVTKRALGGLDAPKER